MAARSKPNELRITRVYDAPVKAVWDAWTDPKQVAQWWGPRGFTLTTHRKELKPGGIWHYTMHGPDGTDYVNKTLYHEVEKHSRLVYDHGGDATWDRPAEHLHADAGTQRQFCLSSRRRPVASRISTETVGPMAVTFTLSTVQ